MKLCSFTFMRNADAGLSENISLWWKVLFMYLFFNFQILVTCLVEADQPHSTKIHNLQVLKVLAILWPLFSFSL